ncbi:MAG: four helix bundle protein [Paludibacteraceae bacterium]|nr:four helix bundle protein [Paludibacteraceae bacterium]
MTYKYSFENLEVWQLSRAYAKRVYEITKAHFPASEMYGLSSQIQRAAVSISSNITEGVSRKTPKEELRFIEVAYASLMETYNQWYIALDINYIDEKTFKDIQQQVDKLANKLNSFARAIERRMEGSAPRQGEVEFPDERRNDSPINQLTD